MFELSQTIPGEKEKVMATSFRFSYLKLITVLVAVSALLFLLLPKSPTRPITQPPGDADRGEYLLAISGCFGCHTDIENEGDATAGENRLTPLSEISTARTLPRIKTTVSAIGAGSVFCRSPGGPVTRRGALLPRFSLYPLHWYE